MWWYILSLLVSTFGAYSLIFFLMIMISKSPRYVSSTIWYKVLLRCFLALEYRIFFSFLSSFVYVDTFDMISEDTDGLGLKFNVSYHFEPNLHSDADKNHPARMKRLAQEAVTLSTSLPLSYSSSVFVRCDTDRLDVMKVSLIVAWLCGTLRIWSI